MRFLPVRVFSIASLAVLAVTVAACGSSGGSSSGSSPSAGASSAASSPASAPSSAAPTSAGASGSSGGGSAAAQIKTNWVLFFNPRTPVTQRVSLLQNGQSFASIIQAQHSSTLASSATSSVNAVTVESATQAKVTYTINIGGNPALQEQPGVAIKQGEVWKVGDQSFCALLTLENNGKAPTACAGAAG